MISTYRRVLGLPGAFAFSPPVWSARLPISMVSLGIVLLVSTRTGSYALAGSVSAAYLISNAIFAVFQARLVDRLGQSRVLPWTINAFAAGLIAMMVSIEARAAHPVPHLFAAISGAALPQVGSCVRARWSYLVKDKRLLQTAFAIEAVVDEAVFMSGPTLVTLLATLVDPVAGLGAAVVAACAGTAVLVSRSGHRAAAAGTGGVVQRRPMPWAVLGPLTFSASLGVLSVGARSRPWPSPRSSATSRTPGRCSRSGRSAACSRAWSPGRSPGRPTPRASVGGCWCSAC